MACPECKHEHIIYKNSAYRRKGGWFYNIGYSSMPVDFCPLCGYELAKERAGQNKISNETWKTWIFNEICELSTRIAKLEEGINGVS